MRALLACGLCFGLSACDISMAHQNKEKTYSASAYAPNGVSARPLPVGTVAQGDLARDEAMREPPAASVALMQHGRERYEIFCLPCHGVLGAGDGAVVKRGFPAPPALTIARLRTAPAQHIFDVVTNGYGVMYPFAAQLPPNDRWAVVAYIRALQLASSASVADAPEAAEKAR
jgi:mono/diheme cytochrome c family protein